MKATISIATAVTCLFFAACEAERLFASKTPQGSGDAPWVQAGVSYEFRLYDAAHAKLLGKVVVTRAEQ